MRSQPNCGVIILKPGGPGEKRHLLRLPPQARTLVPFWNASCPPGSSLEIGFDMTCPGKGRERFTASLWGPPSRRLSFKKEATRFCSWEADTLTLRFRPRRALLTTRLSAGARLSLLGLAWRSVKIPSPVPLPPASTATPKESRGMPRYSQFEAPPDIAGRICSPTSLAMAVAGLSGRSIDWGSWAWRAYDPGSDLFGNWSFGTAAAAETLRERGLSLGCHPAFLSGWEDVAEKLAQGFPVILSIRFGPGRLRGAPIRKSRGHLVLVTGLEDGLVRVHDPAGKSRGGVARFYDPLQLDHAWQGSGRLAYVFRKNRF